MPELTQNNLIKVSVIFGVLLLFLNGVLGLIEITISQDPIFNISSKLFSRPGDYPPVLSNILHTKEFIFLLASDLLLTFALPLLPPVKGFIFTFGLFLFTIAFGYFKCKRSIDTDRVLLINNTGYVHNECIGQLLH